MPDELHETFNDDHGTLRVGDVRVRVGDSLHVEGESQVRHVSAVFGRPPNAHAACRGSGSFPLGPVRWRLLPPGSTPWVTPVASVAPATARAAAPSTAGVVPRPLSCGLFAAAAGWRPAGELHIVGFDSAWTAGRTGALTAIRAADDGLAVAAAPAPCTFDRARDLIAGLRARGPVLLAIDQPLVVPNATGSRPVDRVAGSLISRRRGGVQPANTSKAAMFGPGAPIWRFLGEALPTSIDPRVRPDAPGSLWALEVFPALASVGLFPEVQAAQLLKYNPVVRRMFSPGDWLGLTRVLATIAGDLRIPALVAWARRLELAAPTKALQDEIDAVLCALVGLLIQFSPATIASVGDALAGYIVTPCPPALRPELRAAAARVGVLCTFAAAL